MKQKLKQAHRGHTPTTVLQLLWSALQHCLLYWSAARALSTSQWGEDRYLKKSLLWMTGKGNVVIPKVSPNNKTRLVFVCTRTSIFFLNNHSTTMWVWTRSLHSGMSFTLFYISCCFAFFLCNWKAFRGFAASMSKSTNHCIQIKWILCCHNKCLCDLTLRGV